MQSREKNLKDQLSLYTDKYEDFQSSLKKSNDIFVSYKAEIDKVKFEFICLKLKQLQHHITVIFADDKKDKIFGKRLPRMATEI